MFSYRFKINSNGLLIAKLMFGSAFLFSLIFFPFVVNAFSTNWDENFEAYNVGLLSDNVKWEAITSDVFFTTDTGALILNGVKAGKVENAQTQTKEIRFNPSDDVSTGEKNYTFNIMPFYWTGSFWGYLELIFETLNGELRIGVVDDRNSTDEFKLRWTGHLVDCETGSEISYHANIDWGAQRFGKDEWVEITIEANFTDKIMKLNAESGETEWAELCVWPNNELLDTMETIKLVSFFSKMAFDYFYFSVPEPPPVRVWGISPNSATEITDLDTNFTFGWEGLDYYDGLLISFYDKGTRIHSNAKRFETDVIGFEGQNVINLQNFVFDTNADWYFHALAFVEQPEVSEGMFLTGRYITEYTYNVVSPEYFLTINIEGFPVFFEMEDWETWYGEHAEKFEAPTPLFERVALLFTPTFENIGEFGHRISAYFEIDKAYSRGYELGSAVPIFSYYISSIEMFFGGLPIVKLFLMTLLLMVGIFLFKIIMRFIPFL